MRRVKEVVIDALGRDQGKSFILTEMSAVRAERWGTRAMLLAVQAGVDVGSVRGMAGVALAGIQAITKIKFDEVQPLLDEMLECVTVRPAPKDPDPAKASLTRALFIEQDIEEVTTLMRLREEVIDLHLGFSIAEALSKFQKDSAMEAGSDMSIT